MSKKNENSRHSKDHTNAESKSSLQNKRTKEDVDASKDSNTSSNKYSASTRGKENNSSNRKKQKTNTKIDTNSQHVEHSTRAKDTQQKTEKCVVCNELKATSTCGNCASGACQNCIKTCTMCSSSLTCKKCAIQCKTNHMQWLCGNCTNFCDLCREEYCEACVRTCSNCQEVICKTCIVDNEKCPFCDQCVSIDEKKNQPSFSCKPSQTTAKPPEKSTVATLDSTSHTQNPTPPQAALNHPVLPQRTPTRTHTNRKPTPSQPTPTTLPTKPDVPPTNFSVQYKDYPYRPLIIKGRTETTKPIDSLVTSTALHVKEAENFILSLKPSSVDTKGDVSNTTVLTNSSTKSSLDEKRKARAERFGIPVVSDQPNNVHQSKKR